MAKICAFRDCGDPDCRLCALARVKTEQGDEGKRLAQAVPKALRKPSPTAPKRKHRVGPHR